MEVFGMWVLVTSMGTLMITFIKKGKGILMRVYVSGVTLPDWVNGNKSCYIKSRRNPEREANILWRKYEQTGNEEFAELALLELEGGE